MSESRQQKRALFRQAMLERGNKAAKKTHAHELVMSTASEMAHEVYDEIMTSDNELYAEWQSLCPDLTPALTEQLFVEMLTPLLLEPARATLAGLLGDPTKKHLHDTIYDALVLDNALRAGRGKPSAPRSHLTIEDGQVISRNRGH